MFTNDENKTKTLAKREPIKYIKKKLYSFLCKYYYDARSTHLICHQSYKTHPHVPMHFALTTNVNCCNLLSLSIACLKETTMSIQSQHLTDIMQN